MKVLKVNDFALQSYRSFVKGNRSLSSNEVAKKLTRNVLLAKKIAEIENQAWYAYGKLRILVEDNTVTCVMNNQKVVDGIDQNKKKILNDILGIVE